MLRVTVLGTGYVGLVSGVCLSELGHRVICADKDKEKIKTLQQAKLPIHEDGLLCLLKKNVSANRLSFSSNIEASIHDSDIIIIAVGTPLDADGNCTLEYVNDCAAKIAMHASKDVVVVVKSTVPVGTCDRIQNYLDETSHFNCVVASNPEFLREGNAVHDFMNPDRIVIGTDGRAKDCMLRLYGSYAMKGVSFIYADRRTAELIKYASNTFLAMKVAFINEISDLSQRAGCDMQKLIEGIGSDKRIGPAFLKPGPGFGGSCFPKDVKALINISDALGVEIPLIRNVLHTNVMRQHHIAKAIKSKLHDGDVLAVLGLTYKAHTDDVRESPAAAILRLLINDCPSITIKAFDPCGMRNAEKILPSKHVTYCGDAYEACTGASVAVILTEWECFKEINPALLKSVMKHPRIYDCRGIIDREKFSKAGFHVRAIGYKAKEPAAIS